MIHSWFEQGILAADVGDIKLLLLDNSQLYPIFYLASNIEAPLHTLQDACIVDSIKKNEFNGFKFDCDYIGL